MPVRFVILSLKTRRNYACALSAKLSDLDASFKSLVYGGNRQGRSDVRKNMMKKQKNNIRSSVRPLNELSAEEFGLRSVRQGVEKLLADPTLLK